MNKKFAFPAFVALALALALALASCSDMAPGSEIEAIKHELPKDFDAANYMEINPDVMSSQLAMQVKSKNDVIIGFTPTDRSADCKVFLSDIDFAKKIYLDFLGCPEKGWDSGKSCEGQEAFMSDIGLNNAAYSNENSCNIRGCWSGGWEEYFWDPPKYETFFDCSYECELENDEEYCFEYCTEQMNYSYLKKPLVAIWDSVQNYHASYNYPQNIVFGSICTFNILQTDKNPSLAKDKEFVEAFTPDESLASSHFAMAGRYEGRPYRNCGDSDFGELRVTDMSVVKTASVGSNPYPFNDYSINPVTSKPQFFCLNKGDKKVYRIK